MHCAVRRLRGRDRQLGQRRQRGRHEHRHRRHDDRWRDRRRRRLRPRRVSFCPTSARKLVYAALDFQFATGGALHLGRRSKARVPNDRPLRRREVDDFAGRSNLQHAPAPPLVLDVTARGQHQVRRRDLIVLVR